jgi:hypothetical protein
LEGFGKIGGERFYGEDKKGDPFLKCGGVDKEGGGSGHSSLKFSEMVQILLAVFFLFLTLYFTHIKRDLRPMAIFLTLTHIFSIWGIFSIFGNIKGAIISIIAITAIMGVSLVGYVLQNIKLAEERIKYKQELEELYYSMWEVLEGVGDPIEFVLKFDRLYLLSQTLADEEDKKILEKIKNVLASRKEIFASNDLREYAIRRGIPKRRWWFYLYELIRNANGV